MVDHPIERAVAGKKNGFEDLLEETILGSIRDLLGESSMRAIVFHLNLERVGSDPQAFDKKLRELLNAPASIIEEIIIKDLFKRLDLFYSPKGAFDFQRYVGAAREFYGSKEKRAA
jgi:hypothetical protein